jgi:acetyl esterase/lipase
MHAFILFFAASLVVPISPESPGPPEQAVNRGTESKPDRSISGVTQSTFTAVLPPAGRSTGLGILVCPGGGYTHLAIDTEGFEVAAKLNEWGIAAFVLPLPLGSKEKLPLDDPAASERFAAIAIEDARSALRIIRARAAEFRIQGDRLGMMGFSAGGHLTAIVGTRGDGAVRPNFMALIYPAVPLGIEADAATPPAFIAQADNDRSAPVDNTVHFYLMLRGKKVPSELHLYATGGHAFGVRHHGTTSDGWTAAFEAWLLDRHYLPSP